MMLESDGLSRGPILAQTPENRGTQESGSITKVIPDPPSHFPLGYCWSVAVAALPEEALERFEALDPSDDSDVQ